MPYSPLRRPVFILIAAAATASVAGQAPAEANQPQSRVTAPSPFTGRWELDLTRMPSTYGPPPKRVVYDFQDIGGGRRRLTVDITGQDNSVRHMAVSYRPDGTTVRSEGETSEADSAAIMTPAPNVLVLNLARAKMPGSVRVYIVSASGNEMTESAADLDAEGEPFVRNFRYTRMR